jgi:uncharacterized protein YndB with AHSA1/START domain
LTVTAVSQDVIEIERRIAARPETVFAYFTDAARYRLWQGVEAELDPRPGGIFRVTMTGRSRTVATGAYVEVEPPTRVVFTWGWEQREGLPEGMAGLGPGVSTVEVLLSPDGEGTMLRMRHSGLPGLAACNFHTSGWDTTLDRLVIVAGGGDPGPSPLDEL